MMKRYPLAGSLVLAALLIIAVGCVKDPAIEKLPDLTIKINPTKGTTTDNFEITVTPAVTAKAGRNLFYRWDWDNDGTWDTPYSSSNQVKHRFLHPGSHTVRLDYADGKKQVKTEELTILVDQGYSAPHANFNVNTANGNIHTVFTFDASSTRDDEDSINQLKFKWDFLGDGHWDANYSNNPAATYQYKYQGIYNPKVEVRDPSGLFAVFSRQVTVTLQDSLIIAAFTVNDTLIRVGDTLLLDASASYHSKDPRRMLLYSWMLPERVEWTTPVAEKQTSVIIHQEGQFNLSLKVIDKETNLFNVTGKTLFAADQNLPPTARIRAGSNTGNIFTQFYFDSWLSGDDHLAPSELNVRWDFDGDGTWDTPYSLDKIVYHQYAQAGDYNLTLQVKDDYALTSVGKKPIHVSPNTNETGYIHDYRDDNFYGTVKIGNQWWMSQNLNFMVPQKLVGGVYQWLCLFENSEWCDQVGKMYRIAAVVKDRRDDEYVNICPTGWRLPAKEDWETLFNTVGGEQHGDDLRYGGKSDFNALDLGYISWYFVYDSIAHIVIVDTVFQFKDTFQKAWFLSTTEPKNEFRTDMWMWHVDKGSNLIWSGYDSRQFYTPVRCIKDE